MTPAGALLAAYDRQIRTRITTAEIAGGRADRSSPLIRKIYPGERALVTYCDLAGLTGPALDDLIAAQRDHFTRLGIDDSAPVLTRLGLLPAATTIPFIWSPPAGQGGTRPERSADA